MKLRQGPQHSGLKMRLRHAFRPAQGRKTTAAALGAAGALIAGIVVSGMGAAGANPDLSDIGAWLTSDSKSTAVHVNGLTGQVDGRVRLPTGDTRDLQVSEDGKSVLVLDSTTGTVSRIDPAQLTVPQVSEPRTAGLQLASGGGKAWLADAANGTVQAIDPVTLASLGAPMDMGGKPLGQVLADPNGTLWVPIASLGHLVPVNGEQVGSAIKVAEPGGMLLLTLASGRPVVTDVTGGRVLVVSATGIERTVELPTAMTSGKPEKLLAPGLSEGPVVPLLASDTGTLTLVDIDSGSVKAVPLTVPQHQYGPPQVLGAKVYIPDRDAGTLLVYNTVQGAFEEAKKVTGVPGNLETFVREGLLWVNDAENATAAVVNVQGQMQLIGKYDVPQPSGAASGTSTPTPAKSVPEGGVTTSAEAGSSTPVPSGQETSGTPTGEGTPGTSPPPTSGAPVPPQPEQPPGGSGDSTGPIGGDDGRPPTREPDPRPTQPEKPDPTRENPKPPVTKTADPPSPPVTPPPVTPPPVTPPPVTPPPVTPPPVTPPPVTPPPVTTPPVTTPPAPTTTPPSPTTTSPKPTTTSPKPTTTPPMKPPGTPVAQSGPGKITLMFTPSSSPPVRYRLGGAGAGLGVTPLNVGPKGPFMFTVSGGSCDKEYSFYIIAEYSTGVINSKSSTPIRPCVPPGKPTGLNATTAAGGKAQVTWKPPTNTAGETITYRGSWSVKPAAKPAAGNAAADGQGPGTLTPVGYGALIADAPAENHPTVADGTDVAAAAAPTKGSWVTTSKSVTLSVQGVSGQYTFSITAESKAGKTRSAPAVLTITLTYGKITAVSIEAPPEAPGTAPYPPTPSPSGPGDGPLGAVAIAAVTAPTRRAAPVLLG